MTAIGGVLFPKSTTSEQVANPMPRTDAAFLPVYGEVALARRCLAAMLVTTRQALALWRAPVSDEQIAMRREAAIRRLRSLTDGTLRRSRCLLEPSVRPLLARVAERLRSVGGLASPADDKRYRLLMLEADAFALLGNVDEAMACLGLGLARINFMQSYELRDEFLLRALDLGFALGRPEDPALACLRDLAERRQRRLLPLAWFDAMRAMCNSGAFLRSPSLQAALRHLRLPTRLSSLRPRLFSMLAASLYLHRFGRHRLRRSLDRDGVAAGPPTAVRAMGGAGDLLMMTPGLRALARKRGGPVTLIASRGFSALFEDNPDVELLPAETLDRQWRPPAGVIDLTDCPAVAGELLEYPRVATNRIELFASGMGITPVELSVTGRRPVFVPACAAERDATTWLEARGIANRPFILLQAQPAESYRAWPGMAAAAVALARLLPVVVVHDAPLLGYDGASLFPAFGLAFRIILAIACRAALIVGPDSAFIHVAGARAIPSIGIFGPTGGVVRTNAYPEARVVSLSDRLACIPCWRNEFTPCRLSGGLRSICLDNLPVAAVVDAARELLGSRVS